MFSEKRWLAVQLVGKAKTFALISFVFLVLLLFFLIDSPRGNLASYPGTVQSVGLAIVKGNAQGVTIQLDDGRVVSTVAGSASAIFSPGDRVIVNEQKHLMLWPDYTIEDKHR
ncbi:hypothetical protein [Solilutibacter silvestris]|uniref:hypothetical protein n=1 Tax=Solilutibacter silvestris TaxID=1645665 RepID=UPI00101ADA52|nr:hypothetical protein [Lysobacter silvestris]